MQIEEELELCERFYSQAIAWATSDEEELAIAQDLLERAHRGFVVNDAGTDLVYARDPDLPPDADYLVDERPLQQQRLRTAAIIVGGFVLALLVVFLVYRQEPARDTDLPATSFATRQVFIPTQTLTPTPTSFPTATATPTHTPVPTTLPTATPTPQPPEEIEIKPQPVKLDADAVIPVSLEIAGRYFPVVPTGLRDGTWAFVTDPGQVSWLAGSQVNIVLGLPYTPDNLKLVATTLTMSDTLILRNNVGATHQYQVVARHSVDVFAVEAFNQRRAGLTLALLGGNDEEPNRRLVVQAIPVPMTAALPSGELPIGPGEEVIATEGD
jgi:hypothetical protein